MWFIVTLVLAVVCLAVGRLRRIPWVSGLHHKCVVVTGCDSGFGNALAKSLYSRGVFVFAGCFTEDGAKRLKDETGERLKIVKLDVSKTESIEKAFEFVKHNLPANTVLWGLVNNAGIGGEGVPTDFITRADMHEVMNVNCFGMVDMVRVFLPLIKQSKGRIVNTASMAGFIPLPGISPYVTSKFALTGFSEALRHEQRAWGIKVSTIFPGVFATNILNTDVFEARLKKKWDTMDPTSREDFGKEYFDKHVALMKKDLPKISWKDLTPVVRANEHALFATNPYARYYPGSESHIMNYVNRWLPDVIFVKLFDAMRSANVPKALQK